MIDDNMSKEIKTPQQLFEEELEKLQKKYNVLLYAANCMMPNWEVLPLIKMQFSKVDEKKDEDINKK